MGQTNRSSADEAQQRLERAIAAYLDDLAHGKVHDPGELLAAHPDSADDLRQFLEDHERILQLAQPWRSDESGRLSSGQDTPHSHHEPTNPDGRLEQTAVFEAPGSRLGRFGDYELLHEIARGGMGVVYKARQLSLNRIVAIKMILQGRLQEGEDIERFQLEAKAIAKLTHPHIVVIHDVGQCGDQHYFSMEYVEGQSLAELLRGGSLTFQKSVEYVEQVARAVHFAHQHGVIHRDIKPSNVLIDETDRARVTDFGLAKHIDRGQELTVTGQLLGTPAYMAPEQITNRHGEIGPSCDVYGLGVLLYELLTGQPPFRGRDHIDTLLQILECDPPEPRQLNPNIPRELEVICLKCLEKDPKHRYASAGALAEDLGRYLQGDSLSISSPKMVDRVVRTLERSQFDREVQAASRFVLNVAWIAFLAHAAVYVNYLMRAPHPFANVIATRLAEAVAMFLAFWPWRKSWFPPRGAAARQLWSIWLGYLIGSLMLFVLDFLLTPQGEVFYGLRAYPAMAVLASLCFFVLGSSYWGYCYVLGAVFFALAFLMTFWLGVAPLFYGAVWAASLSTLSVRLGRLAENP